MSKTVINLKSERRRMAGGLEVGVFRNLDLPK